MQALFSIIIPTHNAEKHLKRCIQSVINQSYTNIELLIVDYNSTDQTKTIALYFASDKIQFLPFNSSGIYAAMNYGVEKAKGQWLLFLGADDVLYNENTLEQVFKNVDSTVDVLLGKVENINLSSNKVKRIYTNEWSAKMYWRNTIHHQGVLYKKSLLEQYKFDASLQVLADYDLHLRLLKKGVKTQQLSVFIAQSDAGGLSKQFNKDLYKEELKIKKKELPLWAYLISLVVVPLKYLYKS